jgi:succinate-semialdehyde dehydrogenase / glutarate-semialdehyde dehydrogenase
MTLVAFSNFIDGAFDTPTATFESIDPSTGAPWATMPAATEADVDRAVEAAHRTLHSAAWASLTATARGKLLVCLGDLVVTNAGRLAELETRDTGKIIRETRAQIAYVGDYYRYYGGLADKHEGSHVPIDKADMDVTIRREPIGVVAAVVPWNSQLFLSAVKLGPALAAGCTVVLKPASDTPLTALAMAAILAEAGVPAGVVNVLPSRSSGKVVGAMLHDPRVRKVSFTGSTEVGRILLAQAADNVVNTSMELGGNAPFLVFADADLDAALDGAMVAKMRNGGEACTAANRFYVESSVADEFSRRLAERMAALRVGPGVEEDTQVGPLVNEDTVAKVDSLVQAALQGGASATTGGTRPSGPGFYYPPTVLTGVDPGSEILREEIFGPVAPIVTFDDEATAVRLANDTEFGLVAYVYTGDLARGLRVSEAIEAGMVGLNRGLVSDPAAPFGGVKQSGVGREGGHEGMLDYLESKYIAVSW